jgi:tRNA 2-thiouridine synthesizing protein A
VTTGPTRADLELDCRGMICPLPVIELGKRYAEVPVGGLVAVLADDVAARTDVPAWCRMRGQEYVGEETTADGTPRYVVRRAS